MYPEFKKTIIEHELMTDGDSVVVAVSGGIDSMVLLHLLCRLRRQMNFDLAIAHVNHMLRGAESDADEALVRGFAKKHDIPCEVLRCRPAKGCNLQDTARKIRQIFFAEVSKKRRANIVAMAHHQDDQAETILLHLLRGSGPAGLAGMRYSRTIGAVKLMRPLLNFAREDISRYAEKNSIPWREDETNAGTKYTRNSLRHDVIPLLCEFNPRIVSHLAKLAGNLSSDEEVLSEIAAASLNEALIESDKSSISLIRPVYAELPAALRGRMLRLAFQEVNGSATDLNSDQLKKMDDISLSTRPKGSYRLPSSWKFTRERDVITIVKSQTACDRDR